MDPHAPRVPATDAPRFRIGPDGMPLPIDQAVARGPAVEMELFDRVTMIVGSVLSAIAAPIAESAGRPSYAGRQIYQVGHDQYVVRTDVLTEADIDFQNSLLMRGIRGIIRWFVAWLVVWIAGGAVLNLAFWGLFSLVGAGYGSGPLPGTLMFVGGFTAVWIVKRYRRLLREMASPDFLPR